jgi:hypothetical protein
LEPSSTKFFPEFIVTDFSWALIMSSLSVFNKCTLSNYLNICYEHIVTKTINIDSFFRVKIYLCSTHFLKSIIKKAKAVKINKNPLISQRVLKAFIYSFSLLQNCMTLDEFETILFNFYILFNFQRKSIAFFNSFNSLKKFVILRNLTTQTHHEADRYACNQKEDDINKINANNGFISEDEIDGIKKNSPFNIHFSLILAKYDNTIQSKETNLEENEYFCADLFNIVRNYLYIFPLWTGVLLREVNTKNSMIKPLTRMSNNPVECWFKQQKHGVLNKMRNVMPSQFSSRLYQK